MADWNEKMQLTSPSISQKHYTARNRLFAINSALNSFVFIEAAMAAAANFSIAIAVARTYDKAVFSGYITALSAAFVSIAVLRVSFTMPSAVRPDLWYWRKLPALAAVHVLLVIVATILTSLSLLVAYDFVNSDLWWNAAVAAPGVCLWFLGYDFERSFLIKQRNFGRLVGIGTVQLILLTAIILLTWKFKLPFQVLMLAVALLGMMRTLAVLSAAPKLRWEKGFMHIKRGLHKLGPGSVAYLFGGVACSHFPVFALSIYASPEQAAAFGAMRTLYQPAQIFFRSRDVVGQARFHSERLSYLGTIQAQYLRKMTRSFVLSVSFGAALAVFGSWIVHWAYGGRYDGHMATFFLWAVIMIFINLSAVTDGFVSYLSLQNRYAIAQGCSGICMLVLSPIFAARWGDSGAAASAILGWIVIVSGGAYLVATDFEKLELKN